MNNPNLLDALVRPANLKQIRDALSVIPDDTLEKHIVFNFVWGDEHGTCSWKRKDSPKTYWKKRRANATKSI